ncbi:MAG: hypothetical protein J6Y00_02645 [Paludibacteraceae bacterium]|nr:hypothetical protein [Paludibacteraceae bacterium]
MMSKVVRRVTSDEAVLTIATAPKGVVAERESVTYCALLGRSGTQWDNANPRYRIFAPAKQSVGRIHTPLTV